MAKAWYLLISYMHRMAETNGGVSVLDGCCWLRGVLASVPCHAIATRSAFPRRVVSYYGPGESEVAAMEQYRASM
jgi:hypothetical protein